MSKLNKKRVSLGCLGLMGLINYAHADELTACAQNTNPAVYDSATKKVTLPFIDIPVIDVFTGLSTGEIAVFKGSLQMQEGVDDFTIASLEYVSSASVTDVNHAQYSYFYTGTPFNSGGKLTICASIPQVVVLPNGTQIPTPPQKFVVNLQQLAVAPNVFHVANKVKAGGTAINPPLNDCTNPTVKATVQTQLLETFGLFGAISPMVIVDYDSSGSWPFPLSNSVTVPSGTYTSSFKTDSAQSTYVDAVMKTVAQSPNISPMLDGKSLRFNFNKTTRVWSCSTQGLANPIPKECLSFTNPLIPFALCD